MSFAHMLVVLIALAVAFTPAIVAVLREHEKRMLIGGVNGAAFLWIVFCSMVYAPTILVLPAIVAWFWMLIKSFR